MTERVAHVGRVGAELDELTELRRVFGRRAHDISDEATGTARALDRFRGRSSEYVPPLPAHHARGAELAGRLDELGLRVERSRDAIAAADRWVGVAVVEAAYDAESARQAAVTVWHTGPGTWARVQRWALDLDHPERWTRRQVRAQVPGAHGLRRGDVVRLRDQLNDTNRALRRDWDGVWRGARDWSAPRGPNAALGMGTDSVEDLRRLAGRGAGAASRAGATLEDATSVLGRARRKASNSRIGAVARLGGRGVGVAGIAVGGWDVYTGYREGDTEQAVTGALAAISAGAMLAPFPPVQLAGALVAGGLLVHEYRDEIAGAGRAVAGAARAQLGRQVEAARRTAEFAGDAAGAVGDAVADLATTTGDMADAARDAVTGLF